MGGCCDWRERARDRDERPPPIRRMGRGLVSGMVGGTVLDWVSEMERSLVGCWVISGRSMDYLAGGRDVCHVLRQAVGVKEVNNLVLIYT